MKRQTITKALLAALAAGAAMSAAAAPAVYQMKVPLKGFVVQAGGSQVTPSGTPTEPTQPAKTAVWELTAPNSFGSTPVGAFATPDGTLVIKNTGDASGTPGVPNITGTNSADFSVGTNGCGSTVAPASSCSVTVRFKPTAAGTRTAQLTVGNQSVTLTGVGRSGATDPYYAQVTSLLHMDGQPGSQTAVGEKGSSVVGYGASSLASVSKFGPTSLKLGPTWSDQAQYTNNSVADLGSSDFTMELWLNVSETGVRGGAILSHWGIGPHNNTHWVLHMDPARRVMFNAAGVALTDTAALPQNTWVHLAVTRQGSNFTLWKNGVAMSSQSANTVLTYNPGKEVRFGVWDDGGSAIVGYVDEVRVTKGVARYTATFTPPTEAFPNQ